MPESSPALPTLRFNLAELAGSLGDFGAIIPLILTVALVSDANARYILLFFGIWFILTGLYYRLPIPLEPMKAVAAIVIAGTIRSGEIAAAGLILGVIFLVLGYGQVLRHHRTMGPPECGEGDPTGARFSPVPVFTGICG